jgi:hypothetical protein
VSHTLVAGAVGELLSLPTRLTLLGLKAATDLYGLLLSRRLTARQPELSYITSRRLQLKYANQDNKTLFFDFVSSRSHKPSFEQCFKCVYVFSSKYSKYYKLS